MKSTAIDLFRSRPAAKQYTFTAPESSEPQTITLLLRLGSDQIPIHIAVPPDYPNLPPAAGFGAVQSRDKGWYSSLLSEDDLDSRSATTAAEPGLPSGVPQWPAHSWTAPLRTDVFAAPTATYRGWLTSAPTSGSNLLSGVQNPYALNVASNTGGLPAQQRSPWFPAEPAIQENLFDRSTERLRVRLRDALEHVTAIDDRYGALWTELNEIAVETHFEDGMENRFSRRLRADLREHGSRCLLAFRQSVERRQLVERTVVEALKYFGRAPHDETDIQRLGLLCSFLKAERTPVRDAAVIGLSYMGDPFCLPAVKEAAAIEKDDDLCAFMLGVIGDLESEESREALTQKSKNESLDILTR